MVPIFIKNRIPFVAVTIHANNQKLTFPNVLLDTGSAGTLFKTEDFERIGIVQEGNDRLITISGIGGEEFVIQKQITAIEVGDMSMSPFKIQSGHVDYGFEMDGILGADFLLKAGAKIDFQAMTLTR